MTIVQNKRIIPIVIALDFDGTCVTHDFPKIGKDIGAVPVLKELIEKGHQLILFTMRSDNCSPKTPGGKKQHYLKPAVEWFKKNHIPLYGIQSNPAQQNWTSSPKAYAQLYIDDAALGCPLIYNKTVSDKNYVDWCLVKKELKDKQIL